MKRTITLYIAGQKADLDDDALVLLNIQREDLYNPAVVLNSYSQAVTLPGTAANDMIFGHYFRADHAVGSVGFNPLVRVPFSIFADTGEVLVAGYCKLLNATSQKGAHTYEVQLYGSLGEFIYGLAYDADGNKKTLASLDYLGGGDTELDFVIDKTAVADAWARMGGDTSKPAMWDVVNFAPAYNGIPDGDFDAGKALADASDLGLTIPTGYGPSPDGYVLIEFPQEVDEWAAHDLRSYLQRPVLSVKALLEAIAKPENNGGWTLDLSDIDTTAEWPYLRTWITRPLLPSLGTFKQTSGAMSVTFDNTAVGQRVARFDVSGNLPGEKTTLRMEFTPVLSFTGLTAPHVYMHAASAGEPNYTFGVATFIQPVAYDSSNNVVAYGNVLTLCPNPNIAADTLAAYVHFTPQGGAALISTQADGDYDLVSAGIYKGDKAHTLEVSGLNVAYVLLIQTAYTIGWHDYTDVLTSRSGDGTSAYAGGFTDPSTSTSWEDADGAASADGSGTATSTPNSSIRSGARISKQMLLSTEGTPADYLLALCKSFGLYIITDGATKTASIVRRSTLYQNETIDLTGRVDTSQEVGIEPMAIESKWYDWKHEDIGAAFGKEYKENTGRDYGAQRVNTGYGFDAKARNVLDGVVLKGTAAVRASGPFWNYIIDAGHMKPSPFLLPGNKFTAWDGSGNSKETEIPSVGSGATITQYAGGYDIDERAQFAAKDGKPVDGADVLLFAENYFGNTEFPHFEGFHLTDDVADMDTIVGKPCWMVGVPEELYEELKFADDFSVPGLLKNNGTLDTSHPEYSSTPFEELPAGASRMEWTNVYPKLYGFAGIVLYDENQQFIAVANDSSYNNTDGNVGSVLLSSYPTAKYFRSSDFGNEAAVVKVYRRETGISVPHFSRYVLRTIFPDPLQPGVTSVWRSLDFGIPSEVDIPNITYDRGTIYEQAWKRYVADRLDKDTKVLRCRVRLDGLQVGQGLLRKFYFYRGSLWALNKITNYSLTTYDPAECEFIQVQDIDNYV